MEKEMPEIIRVHSQEELLALSQPLLSEETGKKPAKKPRLTPSPSDGGFTIGLYQEHLEEISFLFAQCQALFSDPEIPWPEVAEFEERLAAHIDAIELGEDLARRCTLELLESHLEGDDGDEEEIRGAVYTLATAGGPEAIDEVLKIMEAADEKFIPCFVDALKYTPRQGTAERLFPLLSHGRPEIRAAAARILGYRREGQAGGSVPLLISLLQDDNPQVISAAAYALGHLAGQLQYRAAIPGLERSLAHQDPAAQHYVALALFRMGHHPALEYLTTLCQTANLSFPWPVLSLALCGRADDLHVFIGLIRHRQKNRHMRYDQNDRHVTSNILLAMGILGNVQAVEILIDELKVVWGEGVQGEEGEGGAYDKNLQSEVGTYDESWKVSAGEALELITGAGLRETVTLVDPVDPDELLEGEEEPSVPTVQKLERVCTSYEEWAIWWQKNRSRFHPAIRWRYGKPFDFGLCIDEMASEKARYADRQRAYLEVTIRSGHDIPFEPDWFVGRQKEALHRWQTWWQEKSRKFPPGRWYFQGRET
ncbi:MAG: HEAT repeat domain-containing protein [bacterium]